MVVVVVMMHVSTDARRGVRKQGLDVLGPSEGLGRELGEALQGLRGGVRQHRFHDVQELLGEGGAALVVRVEAASQRAEEDCYGAEVGSAEDALVALDLRIISHIRLVL